MPYDHPQLQFADRLPASPYCVRLFRPSFTGRTSGWAAPRSRVRPIILNGQTYQLSSLAASAPTVIAEHVRESNRLALARCLADSSFKTYDSAWRSWQRCADFYGFNVDCLDDKGKPCTFQVCADLVYLYIGFECGLRQIKPLSVSNTYLPGIAKHFAIHRIENFFHAAAYHEWTKTLLAGYIRIWNEKFPEGQQAKIPFTMILALQDERFLTLILT